jgi:hypothetical protein
MPAVQVWEKAFGKGGAWTTLVDSSIEAQVTEAEFRPAISDIDESTVAWLKAGMVFSEDTKPIVANFFYHTGNLWPGWLNAAINESYLKVDELENADEVDENAVESANEAIEVWEERQYFLTESWGPLALTARSGHKWWLSTTMRELCKNSSVLRSMGWDGMEVPRKFSVR